MAAVCNRHASQLKRGERLGWGWIWQRRHGSRPAGRFASARWSVAADFIRQANDLQGMAVANRRHDAPYFRLFPTFASGAVSCS